MPGQEALVPAVMQDMSITRDEGAPARDGETKESRSARINPDSVAMLVFALAVAGILAIANFVLSFTGLSAVASWAAVPHYLRWVVPVALDGAILVYTVALFIFRAREEGTGLSWTALYFFTAMSSISNALHAWDTGPHGWQGIVGAGVAALFPWSVLIATHTLADLIVERRAMSASEGDAEGATWDGPVPRVPRKDHRDVPQLRPVPSLHEDADGDEPDDATLARLHKEGMSYKQIADLVGTISKSTVERRCKRYRAQLGNDRPSEGLFAIIPS